MEGKMKWDLFFLHAREDAQDVAKPLCVECHRNNMLVSRLWFEAAGRYPARRSTTGCRARDLGW
jgi:hypothetical protein